MTIFKNSVVLRQRGAE
jgi:hypothetical protein